MIVIDGNDGTGKSTLVRSLKERGFHVADRGLPTKLTVDEPGTPNLNDSYVILEAPIEVSLSRLAQAGKDLNEEWHTVESLRHFKAKFREVGASLGALFVDSSGPAAETEARVLQVLQIPNRTLRFGSPKGRLRATALAFLSEQGLVESVGARQLTFQGPFGISCILLKPRAIPELIALEALDFGITGEDIIQDSVHADQLGFRVLKDESHIRICVLGPRGWQVPCRPIRIATEFPGLASKWASSKGLAHIIVHSYGSTEAYVPQFCDLAIDVVETGETAEANGLCVIETLTTSRPALVFRKGSGITHHRLVPT